MTDKVVELLYRSIIQHLAGNEEKAKEYTRKAMKIEKACICGGQTVPCRYNGISSKICTKCGLVTQRERIVKKCWVGPGRVG